MEEGRRPGQEGRQGPHGAPDEAGPVEGQQVRVLASAPLTTWSVQPGKQVVVAAEEAGKAYSKVVAEEGRGHKKDRPTAMWLWQRSRPRETDIERWRR